VGHTGPICWFDPGSVHVYIGGMIIDARACSRSDSFPDCLIETEAGPIFEEMRTGGGEKLKIDYALSSRYHQSITSGRDYWTGRT
jgi:hypothetical protein